jgi:hypothetical protein
MVEEKPDGSAIFRRDTAIPAEFPDCFKIEDHTQLVAANS